VKTDALINLVALLSQIEDPYSNAVALATEQIDVHLKSLDASNQLALLNALASKLEAEPLSPLLDTLKDCVRSRIEQIEERQEEHGK